MLIYIYAHVCVCLDSAYERKHVAFVLMNLTYIAVRRQKFYLNSPCLEKSFIFEK
jgi:hypothetical protein